jgi:hypothetical protein
MSRMLLAARTGKRRCEKEGLDYISWVRTNHTIMCLCEVERKAGLDYQVPPDTSDSGLNNPAHTRILDYTVTRPLEFLYHIVTACFVKGRRSGVAVGDANPIAIRG